MEIDLNVLESDALSEEYLSEEIILNINDISLLKKSLKALGQQLKQYKSVIDNLPAIIYIADVIDEDELKTGVRREGTFFGITDFFMRLSMVATIVTVSLVFTSTGWEEYAPNPGADVILGIRLLMVVFPAIALGVSLICLYFYPYPKERVQEIKKQLAQLHEKKMERVKTQ